MTGGAPRPVADGTPARPTSGAIRPGRGMLGYERALARAGLGPIAGADEAGRGACAGPLVAGAVILSDRPSRRIDGLRDSKQLTPAARDRLYDEILAKADAVAWVAVEPRECDLLGMHQADLQGLRRALLRLSTPPEFVLTDGFAVDGLGVPGLAMWKGDRVAACVAAASIVAKVTRDRFMTAQDEVYDGYEFAVHKGYCTELHQRHLDELGPTPIHRWCFDNVVRAGHRHGVPDPRPAHRRTPAQEQPRSRPSTGRRGTA